MTREESISFYKRHSRKLYNISFRIVQDSALAEEIMQDTILKFIMHFDNIQSEKDQEIVAEAWLRRTCVRASIDYLRKQRRDKLFLAEYATEGAASQLAYDDLEDNHGWEEYGVQKIKEAVDSLSAPYRLILTLILFEGLDYEEISSITGERQGTLRTQYSRARKVLAEKLSHNDK